MLSSQGRKESALKRDLSEIAASILTLENAHESGGLFFKAARPLHVTQKGH